MGEFSIITEFFAQQKNKRADVLVGIGDDAAIVAVPQDQQLVITTDSLIENVHFLPETDPAAIGHKALAVNLSDLAAMGAVPSWVTLALTMPSFDHAWCEAFCAGFFALATRYQVQLIGGNLAKGPLNITVEAMGLVDTNHSLLRKNARVGDKIFVTGTLGDAGYGLALQQKKKSLSADLSSYFLTRLNQPEPQIAAGLVLRENGAHAAIDISDGFIADLTHLLQASDVGARINVDAIPQSAALIEHVASVERLTFALTSGDDYELCFTAPAHHEKLLQEKLASVHCRMTSVGEIISDKKLILHRQNGEIYHGTIQGYEHF